MYRSVRSLVFSCCLLLALLAGSAPGQAATGVSLPKMTDATLILDFLPNAVHSGIYHALAAGYYQRNNINLRIIQPTSTSDTLRLIDAGTADFGIADGIDVADQIARGRDAQAIMALVQRPLIGLITLRKSGITTPKGFEGKLVGITGVPSDTAAVKTIVQHAGGDFSKVRIVTIGFNGVQYLESGRIDAFAGFYPADGVQADVDGHPTRHFELDRYGGPPYPGLVIFSTRSRVAANGPLLRAFIDATVHGYRDTLRDPSRSLRDLLQEVPALGSAITRAQLTAYLPLFQDGARTYGYLDTGHLAALSSFLVRNRIIGQAIVPARFGTNQFLPAS